MAAQMCSPFLHGLNCLGFIGLFKNFGKIIIRLTLCLGSEPPAEKPGPATVRNVFKNFNLSTRVHSSRMYTVRCSSRLLGWGCLPRGDIPACSEADTPPVNRMTDRCKNITLPLVADGKNQGRVWGIGANVQNFLKTAWNWEHFGP